MDDRLAIANMTTTEPLRNELLGSQMSAKVKIAPFYCSKSTHTLISLLLPRNPRKSHVFPILRFEGYLTDRRFLFCSFRDLFTQYSDLLSERQSQKKRFPVDVGKLLPLETGLCGRVSGPVAPTEWGALAGVFPVDDTLRPRRLDRGR